MSQEIPWPALHERVLADLDHRNATIDERENAARREFDQALARCASQREVIMQEKTVLEQARKLYSRFTEAKDDRLAA
jgi:hypothetical protein